MMISTLLIVKFLAPVIFGLGLSYGLASDIFLKPTHTRSEKLKTQCHKSIRLNDLSSQKVKDPF